MNTWLPNTHFSYQSQYAPNNYQSQQATLTGAILEDNFISYTLQHNSLNNRCCMRPKNESDTRFYTQYHHNKFILNAGYGYKQEHQLHYGFRSSVVAHPYGITLTPSRGKLPLYWLYLIRKTSVWMLNSIPIPIAKAMRLSISYNLIGVITLLLIHRPYL